MQAVERGRCNMVPLPVLVTIQTHAILNQMKTGEKGVTDTGAEWIAVVQVGGDWGVDDYVKVFDGEKQNLILNIEQSWKKLAFTTVLIDSSNIKADGVKLSIKVFDVAGGTAEVSLMELGWLNRMTSGLPLFRCRKFWVVQFLTSWRDLTFHCGWGGDTDVRHQHWHQMRHCVFTVGI